MAIAHDARMLTTHLQSLTKVSTSIIPSLQQSLARSRCNKPEFSFVRTTATHCAARAINLPSLEYVAASETEKHHSKDGQKCIDVRFLLEHNTVLDLYGPNKNTPRDFIKRKTRVEVTFGRDWNFQKEEMAGYHCSNR